MPRTQTLRRAYDITRLVRGVCTKAPEPFIVTHSDDAVTIQWLGSHQGLYVKVHGSGKLLRWRTAHDPGYRTGTTVDMILQMNEMFNDRAEKVGE